MKTFEKIKYIETIERCSSLTKASNELFISQPYLSKLIKNMEVEIGVKIFKYSRQKTQLTYGGTRFLWFLKEINAVENQMKHEMHLIRENNEGEIVLGVNLALATTFLPLVVNKFHRDFPGISLKLVEQYQTISEQMLISEEMDLALGMAPLQYSDELTSSSFHDEELYLMVSKESQFYKKENVGRISDFTSDTHLLEEEPIILTPVDYGIGKIVSQFYTKNNMLLKSLITTSTFPTAIKLAVSGMGLTFVPQILSEEYVNNESCNLFRLSKANLRSDYILIYRKNSNMEELTLRFFESFLSNFANSKIKV